jgi:hypothetical protein
MREPTEEVCIQFCTLYEELSRATATDKPLLSLTFPRKVVDGYRHDPNAFLPSSLLVCPIVHPLNSEDQNHLRTRTSLSYHYSHRAWRREQHLGRGASLTPTTLRGQSTIPRSGMHRGRLHRGTIPKDSSLATLVATTGHR